MRTGNDRASGLIADRPDQDGRTIYVSPALRGVPAVLARVGGGSDGRVVGCPAGGRLTGAIFFDINASDPWVAETPPGGAIVGTIFPDAEHLISYHVITRGACWGGAVGETPIRLEAGDVIVFPHGDWHVMSSDAGHARYAGPDAISSAARTAVCRSRSRWAMRGTEELTPCAADFSAATRGLQSAAHGSAARDCGERQRWRGHRAPSFSCSRGIQRRAVPGGGACSAA